MVAIPATPSNLGRLSLSWSIVMTSSTARLVISAITSTARPAPNANTRLDIALCRWWWHHSTGLRRRLVKGHIDFGSPRLVLKELGCRKHKHS